MKSVLAGKTCNTMSHARKFISTCQTNGISNTFWVSKFDLGDETAKLLVTFWVDPEKVGELNKISKTIILHRKKTGTLFTINALNKLTEKMKEDGDSYETDEKGNILINWEMYKNKLICVFNGELGIYNLKLLYKEQIRDRESVTTY